MASYLETKNVFGKMVGVNETVDEDSDLIVNITCRKEGVLTDSLLVISNDELKEAFSSVKEQSGNSLRLYSEKSYEVAVHMPWHVSTRDKVISLTDPVNRLEYSIGNASLSYVLMICGLLHDNNAEMNEAYKAIKLYQRLALVDDATTEEYISRVFRLKTITIMSNESTKLDAFNQYCNALEYLYMYKTRRPIMRVHQLSDLFERNGGGRSRVNDLDEPPHRTVNQDMVEYYAMAVDSADPFTAYISFYHVIEYYFDEAYKKKLLSEMQTRITAPDFSYKSESKLYEFAKWIHKRMINDDKNGRGNEEESLKYVLEEYVPIDRLLNALDEWDPSLKGYYETNSVSFSDYKSDKIAWKDTSGVYTNITKRIYNTRNALVHSKSDQSDKRYKPQKHKDTLRKEIPLVQVIAELIISNDGKVL